MKSILSAFFTFKTPVEDIHPYPVGDQLLYCLKPELFKHGFLDMHAIERTYVKDNKQFWREVVKSNIRQIRRCRGMIKPFNQLLSNGDELSPDQLTLHKELKEKITTHESAVRIARHRSLKGFGIQSTENAYAKKLCLFYIRLVQWVRATENMVFRGNVLEDALGIIQKKVYHSDAYEGDCGINNGSELKSILADINTIDDPQWLFTLAVWTEKLSERLAILVKGTGYVSPTFRVSEHFYG